MSKDHRIIAPDGSRIPFSCENKRFSTNLSKPYSHGAFASTPGSVLPAELINHGDASLWLEHVFDKDSGEELYWLMWYDKDGMPTIPLSSFKERLTEYGWSSSWFCALITERKSVS